MLLSVAAPLVHYQDIEFAVREGVGPLPHSTSTPLQKEILSETA